MENEGVAEGGHPEHQQEQEIVEGEEQHIQGHVIEGEEQHIQGHVIEGQIVDGRLVTADGQIDGQVEEIVTPGDLGGEHMINSKYYFSLIVVFIPNL